MSMILRLGLGRDQLGWGMFGHPRCLRGLHVIASIEAHAMV